MPATATKPKHRWTDFKTKLSAAFKARDENEMETLLAEAPEPDDPSKGAANEEDVDNSTDSNDELMAKIDALIARMDAMEASRSPVAGVGDSAIRAATITQDAAPTRDAMQDVYARAEILSPGIQLPTFDSAATPARMRDSMCALRRKALNSFAGTESGRAAVLPFTGGQEPDFAKMSCDAVSSVFVGASEIAKRENHMAATLNHDSIKRARETSSAIVEINKKNHELWDTRK